MNVLVTGSKGYIGSVLMQELERNNYKCKILNYNNYIFILTNDLYDQI